MLFPRYYDWRWKKEMSLPIFSSCPICGRRKTIKLISVIIYPFKEIPELARFYCDNCYARFKVRYEESAR